MKVGGIPIDCPIIRIVLITSVVGSDDVNSLSQKLLMSVNIITMK